MKEQIELLKQQLNEAIDRKGDWRAPYNALMQAVYREPVLFFALSRQAYDPAARTSVPLISTKDFGGRPALYVFSDVDLASAWMNAYHHVSGDGAVGLIGAVAKQPHDFLSIFPVARGLGAEMIMLDEGGDFVGLGMDDFFSANGIDPGRINMLLSEEETQDILQNNAAVGLHFAPVEAIPLAKGD